MVKKTFEDKVNDLIVEMVSARNPEMGWTKRALRGLHARARKLASSDEIAGGTPRLMILIKELELHIAHRNPPKAKKRACRVCGGDGWTESMEEYKKDRRHPYPTNECVFCKGTGEEDVPTPTKKEE